MRGWLFFNNEIADHVPEAAEIKRFIEVGKKRGLTLDVLKPGDFELIVSTEREWRAEHSSGRLARPDFIIPRTGSETEYFTLGLSGEIRAHGLLDDHGPGGGRGVRQQAADIATAVRLGPANSPHDP